VIASSLRLPAPSDGRSSACIWPILVGHPVDLPTAQPPGQLRARPSQPCGYLPQPPPLHDLPVGQRTRERTDTGRLTLDNGRRTPGRSDATPDTGQQFAWTGTRGHWMLAPDTGHRTPDTPDTGHRTLAEDADTVTKARPASAPPGPPRPTAARWTPTVPLGTAPAARSNHDGSAVGHRPARDCRSQYQAPARPPRRPSRASAHCCRVLDLDGTSGGQWDEGKLGCAGSAWLR
jgi:hypothetical protein